MRAVLFVFMLSTVPVHMCAQQLQPSPGGTGESTQVKLLPQDSPCPNQPRSLRELTASFNKGRAPSAEELKGTWVEIGHFNRGLQPPDDEDQPNQPQSRSLNCTGIVRGNKFELAMIGVSYAYVMEMHEYGYTLAGRTRLEPDHKGSVAFSFCGDGDCSGMVRYPCRLTRRGTLACLGSDGGAEFKKMSVADSQLFGVFRP